MSEQQFQEVEFTGERTGLEATRVQGFGMVKRGDRVIVPAPQAGVWTAELPTAALDDEGEQIARADWVAHGDPYEADYSEVVDRNSELRQARLEEDRRDELGDLNKDEFQARAAAAGVDTSGTKDEITDRLVTGAGGETVEDFADRVTPPGPLTEADEQTAGGEEG